MIKYASILPWKWLRKRLLAVRPPKRLPDAPDLATSCLVQVIWPTIESIHCLAEESKKAAHDEYERPRVEHLGSFLEKSLCISLGAFNLLDLRDLVTLENDVNYRPILARTGWTYMLNHLDRRSLGVAKPVAHLQSRGESGGLRIVVAVSSILLSI